MAQNETLKDKTFTNPILEGEYADPDIAFFDDTWYIYPTTDGFDGWSGTQFFVFSSKDGIHFQKEGMILDVKSDQVPWATGCAWAPCIARKNGKYYFYFCAKDETTKSCIGVAVSDSPTGPFVAEPKPLLTMELMHEYHIAMGQTIDPSIYQEGDEVWIAFGNAHPAIAKLNPDMVSIDTDTLQNLEGAYDFREAITVFKRNGLYHFTWSCDDTGSEDYHVNYGTSDKLTGPIQFQYAILEKDPSRDILGTGHHSIIRVPDTDCYRIAYHRFATPTSKYTSGKGYHRETCIADLQFNSEGLIQKVEMPS